MTEPKNDPDAKPARKPGLMVEDRNAVVRTDADGKQTIAKVPDRAAEAERRGVDESQV